MGQGSAANGAYATSAVATAATAAVLVALPVLNTHVLRPWVEASGDRRVWWANELALLAAHVAALGLVSAALRHDRLSWLGAGVDRPRTGHVRAGAAIVIAACLVVAARHAGLYQSTYVDEFSPTNTPERAMFLTNGVVIGGLQEPLWRAFAFRQLRWRLSWPTVSAAVATSISFAYYHGGFAQPGQMGFTFAAGIALSWLYVRSRTIWLPTLAHAAFNVAGGAFA